jgi:hypothetical protein
VKLKPSSAKAAQKAVGSSALAKEFFAGRYAEVVASAFDDGGAFDAVDAAFVVGALTFVGRTEEAQLCFDGLRLREISPEPRTVTASHFFLGLAYARAGNFELAQRFLVAGARARARSRDPWIVAFVFQGLSCHRYFTGHYRAATRHALRALRAAHVASFAYVQMLANDLRGHALAQIGQYRAGIALLEQAKLSSERLGFGMNAYAIECSIVSYLSESVARSEALERIEGLLGRRSHDSYSKRSLLASLAIQLALRGRGREALSALAAADADALEKGTRRAKLTNVVARLHVLRWTRGAQACDALLEQARELVDDGDVALRAELLGFEAYVAGALAQVGRREHAVAALLGLARTTEHHRAQAALEQLGALPLRQRAFPEDEITPLLHAVTSQDRRALSKLLALGLLGPVPELLGLPPAKRIVVLVTDNAVLLEDHGDLQLRLNPPRWFATLVRLLSNGVASKQAMVAALWGLRAYHPERHDSLIRTTVHRFRALLAPHEDWIFVAESGGYGCSAAIQFVGSVGEPSDLTELEMPLAEGEAPEPVAGSATRVAAAPQTLASRAFGLMTGGERLSVRDVARSLGVSDSTALRALRELVTAKRVVRSGHARATRYRARSPS